MAVAFCSCGALIRGDGGEVVVLLLKHQKEEHGAQKPVSDPKPRRRRRTIEP